MRNGIVLKCMHASQENILVMNFSDINKPFFFFEVLYLNQNHLYAMFGINILRNGKVMLICFIVPQPSQFLRIEKGVTLAPKYLRYYICYIR